MEALMKRYPEPRYQYDCGHCKFNWCCGELCACIATLPKSPQFRARSVARLQAHWRRHEDEHSHDHFRRLALAGRKRWYAMKESKIKIIKNYKATVVIRGAMDQNVYSRNMDSAWTRGIKLLTMYKPGFGNTWPQCVYLYEKVGEIRGNLGDWKLIGKIFYKELSEDQLEWKKPKEPKGAK
jgi:hypothetical protein